MAAGRKRCIALLLLFAMVLCTYNANAMLPEVKDVVPRVGRSSKQLFWRKYSVVFADIKASGDNAVKFYLGPSEESGSLGGTGSNMTKTYVETAGDFYACFNAGGAINVRMDYVAKERASLAARKKNYLVRRAGVYGFGLNNSDTSIAFYDCYYIKALCGKTGSYRISRDKEGKDILQQGEFMDGVVVWGANQTYAAWTGSGSYIAFENAELMSADIAPADKIKEFLQLQKAEDDAREEAARRTGVPISEVCW